MHEFWYDNEKPKYEETSKLCYMRQTHNIVMRQTIKLCFIIYIKGDDIYIDIDEDVEKIFYTSTYELDRPLPKVKDKNKKLLN